MSGSKIVICKDKAEAIRMCKAGLLMLRLGSGNWLSEEDWQDTCWIDAAYGMSAAWPPEDFGYLVDEEE